MTGSPSDTLLGQALALAAAGLAVFPLGPTRVPLRDSHGHLDASKDSADVRRLFAAPAAANIAPSTSTANARINQDRTRRKRRTARILGWVGTE